MNRRGFLKRLLGGAGGAVVIARNEKAKAFREYVPPKEPKKKPKIKPVPINRVHPSMDGGEQPTGCRWFDEMYGFQSFLSMDTCISTSIHASTSALF